MQRAKDVHGNDNMTMPIKIRHSLCTPQSVFLSISTCGYVACVVSELSRCHFISYAALCLCKCLKADDPMEVDDEMEASQEVKDESQMGTISEQVTE